jgi:copper transport protein
VPEVPFLCVGARTKRIFVVVASAIALFGLATAASAHATLLETLPADGAQLDRAPSEVIITFDEPVDLPPGSMRVFDDAGRRVDLGDPGHGSRPDQVRVSLGGGIGEGWFVATWSVVSADGHPLRGAFQFEVGTNQEAIDPGVLEAILGQGGSAAASVAAAVVRWISYLGGLGSAGALLFLTLTRSQLSELGQSRLHTLIRTLAIAGISASVLSVPLFAIESSGLELESVSLPALSQAATSPYGIAAAVRIAVLVTPLVASLSFGPIPALFFLAGIAVAETLAGHTLSTSPGWLMIAANLIHVGSAAIWIGGLAALGLAMRSLGRNGPAGARMVAMFSRLALWTVVALAGAGLILAWLTVRAPRALISTAFGWTLLAKTAVMLAVLAVARYNRSTLVPAIVGSGSNEGWSRLKRTVRFEVIGLVVAVAVTALLVTLPPAAEAAGVTDPFSTTAEFGAGLLNLVVDPNRAGVNEVHVYTLDQSGLPTSLSGELSMGLSMPHHDIGPLERNPIVAGPGHWILSGPELSIPGTWEITIRRVEGFDEDTVTIPVTVNP